MQRAVLAVCGLLAAAAAAAGAWSVLSAPATEEPLALSEAGIGPLLVGRRFEQAQRRAFQAAPETAFSGVGCAGLDEIRYDGWLGEHPVAIMAMSDQGRIREVEATLYSPATAKDRQACLALRDHFAAPFIERFGPYSSSWQSSKPVSEELLARTGPVVVVARWFSMGGSCYVSAHYGVLEGGSVRLGESPAAMDQKT